MVGGYNPSEKYEFVSWDDDIPNIWENKIHVPNHQPDASKFNRIMIRFEEILQHVRRNI